jgi:hypothetical protein
VAVRIGSVRWLLIPVLIILVLGAFFVLRAGGSAEIGPPAALCPGPDGYGYTCAPSGAFPYVDATNDLELYEDDGLVEVVLPFQFSFYGTSYDVIRISSNGNLQFSGQQSSFENICLSPEPAAGMGDMIAPYWDDLNLSFAGAIETEVVGTAPERSFVIEWDDVPSFSDIDDRVTFEVQLHEGTNDIVFLYEDVARQVGNRGSSATIGLQSEAQGFALQFGCNQLVLRDGGTVQFVHPLTANPAPDNSLIPDVPIAEEGATPVAKGIVAQLTDTLNRRGLEALPGLRAHWLAGNPKRASQFRNVDVDGDGLAEVVILWTGSLREPYLTQLAVVELDGEASWRPEWVTLPLARQDTLKEIRLHSVTDVTGDGPADIILLDAVTGRTLVVTKAGGSFEMYVLPGKCAGGLVVRDGATVPDIVRDGCDGEGRMTVTWRGNAFARS